MPRAADHSGTDCLLIVAGLILERQLLAALRDPMRRDETIHCIVGSLKFLMNRWAARLAVGATPLDPAEVEAIAALSEALDCPCRDSEGQIVAQGFNFLQLALLLLKYLPEILELLNRDDDEPAPQPEPNFSPGDDE